MIAQPKTLTAKIGKHDVEFIELSFADSLAVDHRIPVDENGVPSSIALSKIYAIAALRRVDGEVVNPCADDIQWGLVAKKFTAMEAFALAKAYGDAFPTEVGEQLKNESSDQA